MLNELYHWLAAAGYEHPLHPAIVHIPIGTVLAAWIFCVLGILRSHDGYRRCAYYCSVLAFLFVFPTVFLGVGDWQHYFAGQLIRTIELKMIFAACLTVSLGIVALLKFAKSDVAELSLAILPLASINVALAICLGFLGGNLVYGGKQPQGPPRYAAGASLFESNCVGCHARGGNTLKPNLPVIGAPQLASESEFAAFLRNPHMPDSATGEMPGFDGARLSDQEIATLYQYITKVLDNPRAASVPRGP